MNQVFGVSNEVMEQTYKPRWDSQLLEPVCGPLRTEYSLYAMSILSDAQELMARGDAEEARQFINRAKYVLAEGRQLLRRKSLESGNR